MNDVFDEKLSSYENVNNTEVASKDDCIYHGEGQLETTTESTDDLLLKERQQSSTKNLTSAIRNDSQSQQSSPPSERSNACPIWSTVIAKVVTAYRRDQSVGKIGLALLTKEDSTCKLIIYRSKTNILGSIQLQKHSDTLSKHHKFWQFYDECGVYWSIYFNGERDEGEFLEQLLLKGYHLLMPADEGANRHRQVTRSLEKLNDNSISGMTNESSTLPISQQSSVKCLSKAFPVPSLRSLPSDGIAEANVNLREVSRAQSTEEILTHIETFHKSIQDLRTEQQQQQQQHQPKSEALTVPPNMKENNNVSYMNIPTMANAQWESQYFQMLVAEQRTLGSELRINVNRLSDKTDQILSKLHLIDKQNSALFDSNIAINTKISTDDDLLELEERLLALKKENRKLRLTVEELQPNTIPSDNHTKEILQDMSESLLSLNITSCTDLKVVLNDLVSKCQKSNEALRSMSSRLQNEDVSWEENQRDLAELKSLIKKYQKKVKASENNEAMLRKRVQELEADNEKLQLELKLIKDNIDDSNTELKPDNLTSAVKTIMNDLYLEIATRLHNDNHCKELTNRLLGIIGATIRHQTLKTLKAAH